MAMVDVKCPFCKQTDLVKKHVQGSAGHHRYRCQTCYRSFQPEYKYRACQQGMDGSPTAEVILMIPCAG